MAMQRILVAKIAIFAVLLFSCAFLLDKAVERGVKKALCREWEDLVHSRINADLLIQGSSRAWVGVSPRILDEALRVDSYNIGIDGHEFLMQYYWFKMYLQYNRKPRYIVQVLDMHTLNRRKDLYGITQFAPYLDSPPVRTAVSYYQGFEWQDYYLPLCKYMNSRNDIVRGLMWCIASPPYHKYKGFQAQEREWDAPAFGAYRAANPDGSHQETNGVTTRLFDEFLAFCGQNGIQVILVYAPEYIAAQELMANREEIMGIYRSYARKYCIPLLDYSPNPVSYDTRYFYNSQHLNARGVAAFNRALAEDLARLMHRGPAPKTL